MEEWPLQGEDLWEVLELMERLSPSADGAKFLTKIAGSDKNVLILGETGTGKDVLATVIHRLSQRREQPFVSINCASIPQDLFEAELFGFCRGAFTGAVKEKTGLLEAAGKGTVFMDEIGELALSLQAKLLRVIDKRVFRRLGEIRDRICQARFIFATNKELNVAVNSGDFRPDLYYRINVIQLRLIPLRYQREIIPKLVRRILANENKLSGLNKKICPEALEKLMGYDFPGNIRELINIVERAVLVSEGDWIKPQDVRFDTEDFLKIPRERLSADKIREVLEVCRWNKTEAARRLGTSRRHFYRLLQKFRVSFFCP